ncbi:MAG: glycerol-3-phosphate responsive antiterminator [Ruminococcaceae bacterium]|nr:glycerol-3-phosphate responsive antiterminator [Oscillospiraceae bacterium]
MHLEKFLHCLEKNPVIAAVSDDKWGAALASPATVLFYLSADVMTVRERVSEAHAAGKHVLVHVDLAEGIGKDTGGIRYLADVGADGILSTRAVLIRAAKEYGLLTVQRFFALDSKGLDSVEEMLHKTSPHLMEIMPGVIGKAIRRFSVGEIPVIAGGLVETANEAAEAFVNGATAVSTGAEELWNRS